MTDSRVRVRAAIVEQLTARGYPLPRSDQDPGPGGEPGPDTDADLIGLGVNSVALIQILSALEDAFDVDLDVERLFSGPVTLARLETQITALL